MRRIITIASILAVAGSTTLFSQRLFVEPEIGMYQPSDKDYESGYAPRFGGNAGLAFQDGVQLYGGYKIWKVKDSGEDSYLDSWDSIDRFKTVVFGLRKTFMLGKGPLGARMGAEYLLSSYYEEIDFFDFGFILEFEGTGTGGSFEGGLLYEISESIHLLVALNYLVHSVTFDGSTANGLKISRQELGISESEATFNLNGINFKASLVLFLN